ncbi:hypothetical protein [Agrobacterium pusense]|uniref:hypothetical protein n=1 Tax=Agrobacterium pusense TaxID=648995 RepID=UPI002FDEE1EC
MFEGAKLKILWAKRHIQDIEKLLKSYLESDFYTLKNEYDDKAGFYRVTFEIKKEAPQVIPLLIGDAIHNLRVALDHIAAEIVGVHSASISFPFHENKHNHTNAEGKLLGHAKTIDDAKPGLGRFIVDEIRPYSDGDGNKLLWSLSKLDNMDKHRLLIPTVTLTGVSLSDLYDKENDIKISMMSSSVTKEGVIDLIGSDNPFVIRGKIEPHFSAFFGEATYFDNDPIVETLSKICVAVSEALAKIETFTAEV